MGRIIFGIIFIAVCCVFSNDSFEIYNENVGMNHYEISHKWEQSQGAYLDYGYIHKSRLRFSFEKNGKQYYYVSDVDGWTNLRNEPNESVARKVFNNQIVYLDNINSSPWYRIYLPEEYVTQEFTETWISRSKEDEWHTYDYDSDGHTDRWRSIDTLSFPNHGYEVDGQWANINAYDKILSRNINHIYTTTFANAISVLFDKENFWTTFLILLGFLFGIIQIRIGFKIIKQNINIRKAERIKTLAEAANAEVIRKETEKRENIIKWLNENNIDNSNIRNKVKKGAISLEKAIEEQSNFNVRKAQEAKEEEERKKERKKEREKRTKILDDNKITDEITRNSFISNRYDIKTAISKQKIINKRENHKKEMNEVIQSYKFYSSQTYVLSKEKIDLYTVSKKDLIDRCNRIKNLGVEICKAIKDSRVVQGMTKEVVLISMGKPGDTEETVYKTKTKAYYYYQSYKTRQNKTRYKFRVDLENDIVVGWKDLD